MRNGTWHLEYVIPYFAVSIPILLLLVIMRSPRHDTPNPALLRNATHLIILQHGLLGSRHDFARFSEIFRSCFQLDDFIYLHAAESNATSFFKTYDGIDRGGERLADEIQKLVMQMPNLKKFSMIGHSLGGLYNRYCIGLLLCRGFFDKIEPVNFMTFATPHLGIRRPRRGASNAMFNALMPKIFGRTGTQLTLKDVATDTTQALSLSLSAHADKKYNPCKVSCEWLLVALSDVNGTLLVSLPTTGKQCDDVQEAFELFDCVLSGRKLQVYEDREENKIKFEIDMSCTDVTISLPSGKGENNNVTFYSSFINRVQNENIDQFNESGNFDIQIRVPASAKNKEKTDTSLCVLRIPEDDIHRDWKWLVAISNAGFGACCQTSKSSTKKPTTQVSTKPLLSCLTRGQFMQALQMFKVRTLYSNIFFDMQVPYTCAAVRAFNPYRLSTKGLSTKEFTMSPVYTHIAFDSLKSAWKLRDTIPPTVKRLALTYMTPDRAALVLPSMPEDLPPMEQDAEDCEIIGTGSTRNSPCIHRHSASEPGLKSASAVRKNSSRHRHIFRSRRHGKSVGSAPSKDSRVSRPEPFVEGDVILDQLPYAFTADTEQDELCGMLLSMQSVGWRRVDVLFGGILSHEHIIAKRAKLHKPLDSGVDVVHHVIDTFVV
ncbi:hypothetical protein PsorP6_005943 [Peronosclerospora sorghi]|uniref:Uncharacterized protein n=1 Tax=Peronosclerospora sorghi TaxID=230839 RepID=A0ACC0W5V0_9STRA|nr:hypothetical protein PsorP6_005943 [Peronosclerospora sorghi]